MWTQRYLILIFLLCSIDFGSINAQVYEKGISKKLAEERKDDISDLSYRLAYVIPENIEDDVLGNITIEFEYLTSGKDLLIDFQASEEFVLSVMSNSNKVNYKVGNKHIVIQASDLVKGKNSVNIKFIASNASLNRNEEYLYTLFVPNRASQAFPCFDQPDLKAKYELIVSIPEKWIAVSNGAIEFEKIENGKKRIKFAQTLPISTYHFSVAAGDFKRLTRTKNGRTINMYHRESNLEKVEKNAETLFDMHFSSLKWMEDYTGVKYPFGKFDFVVIPSFQYRGMEHVGNIYYRNSIMFLSESASIDDVMNRAKTIAHEVSHMWFGDLVTMKWFDDVWLKEVYAEFFASKMVDPMFPDMNHDLNFIVYNYPRAYLTDRTEGTHAIIQRLENLDNAGALYGKIIYNKAPIMMAKLEHVLGKDKLKKGLIEYLNAFSFGNASWADLIQILDKYYQGDLNVWSRIWVEEKGMPTIFSKAEYSNGMVSEFKIMQEDPFKEGHVWNQHLEMVCLQDGNFNKYHIILDKKVVDVTDIIGTKKPELIMLNGNGYGYGYFVLDDMSMNYLLNNTHTIKDEVLRAVSYITLNQAVINYQLAPKEFIAFLARNLKKEKVKQNLQLQLDYLETCWWHLIEQKDREQMSGLVEGALFYILENESNLLVKSQIFKKMLDLFISKHTAQKLYYCWRDKTKFYGVKPSGTDYSHIALALAVRDYPGADGILKKQLGRIKNYERRNKMKFIMQAASSKVEDRDAFFKKLERPENREQEIWVRTALSYLNHPLRADVSVKYLPKALDMLEEIQRTGDIFFPKNWLVYTIGRYNTPEAADIVRNFLDSSPDLNHNLRLKVLQYSDLLFRSQKMQNRDRMSKMPPGNGE